MESLADQPNSPISIQYFCYLDCFPFIILKQTKKNNETKEWREGSHEKKQYSIATSILYIGLQSSIQAKYPTVK